METVFTSKVARAKSPRKLKPCHVCGAKRTEWTLSGMCWPCSDETVRQLLEEAQAASGRRPIVKLRKK